MTATTRLAIITDMNEASKTRKLWSEQLIRTVFTGAGLDIGCGSDPIFPSVTCFDKQQGDANWILDIVSEEFDFVFASHVLEHMIDPRKSIVDWYRLVKPGGHLVILVPDEDLYEQGAWPSMFNADHKWTFTISKNLSWSPRSINLYELAETLGGNIVSLEVQDNGYDRRLQRFGPSVMQRQKTESLVRFVDRHPRFLLQLSITRVIVRALAGLGFFIDQTAFHEGRLAQIQLIIRKPLYRTSMKGGSSDLNGE